MYFIAHIQNRIFPPPLTRTPPPQDQAEVLIRPYRMAATTVPQEVFIAASDVHINAHRPCTQNPTLQRAKRTTQITLCTEQPLSDIIKLSFNIIYRVCISGFVDGRAVYASGLTSFQIEARVHSDRTI